jgi:predicted amino acid-binding ACT domain protein
MNAPITAAHTHMGTPPSGYNQEWGNHTVHVHGFASLSTVRGECVASSEFMLLGNQWRLRIYPGGSATAAEGMASLSLENMSNKSIDIDYGFSVSDGNGKRVAYGRSATPEHFEPEGTVDLEGIRLNSWGFTNFGTRLTLLSSLINGTLVIEVHMRLAKPTKSVPSPYIPENPFVKNIQQMIMDENFGDISFAVGGEQKKNSTKKVAKTAPVMFHAHRDILSECLTGVLADICRSSVMSSSPIKITDVSPEVFCHLLHSAYGVKVSEEDMKSQTKEIIDAANRYGVVNLKLEAEAYFVGNTIFTLENVMEHLLYAESMNCALLKEAAMDFIIENSAEIMDKISINDLLTPTLMRDVLAAVSRGMKKFGGRDGDGGGDSRFNSMRICELRRESHEKGLNVDGSREMLIAALKGTH